MATPAEHTPLGQLAEQYWVQSRRPLASLVFIAPLLLIYEAGVLLLGVQNGADAFMRRLLDLLGFGQHFVLPLLTVCILLGWHYLSREPWRLSGGTVSAMAVESLMLGICLRAISLAAECAGRAEHRRKDQGRGGIPGSGNLRGTAVPPDPAFAGGLGIPACGGHAAGEPDSGGDPQQSAVCRRPSRGPLRREAGQCTPSCFVLWRGSSFRSCLSIADSASPRAAMPRTTSWSACWARMSAGHTTVCRLAAAVRATRPSAAASSSGTRCACASSLPRTLPKRNVLRSAAVNKPNGQLLPGHAVRWPVAATSIAAAAYVVDAGRWLLWHRMCFSCPCQQRWGNARAKCLPHPSTSAGVRRIPCRKP